MNHRCSGRQLVQVRKLVTPELPRRSLKYAQMTQVLALPPGAKQPWNVSPCQRFALRCPTPKLVSCLKDVSVSKNLEDLAREVVWLQGQPVGKKEDSETIDENGPLFVPKSARVVSGRQHHRLRMLVDHLMCRDGRSEESLLERRVVRTLAARRNYETALGTFLKFVKERALPLVEDVEIDGVLVAYSNDCFIQGVQHHHGSQLRAALMDRWPSFSRFGSRKTSEVPSVFDGVATVHTCAHSTSNACTCLGRHCNTTRPSQSSSSGTVHSHLAGDYMRPSELLS